MTKQFTRWSPDTCGCTLVYEWDDTLPAQARAHTLARVEVRCAAHQNAKPDQAHYLDVVGENQGKNRAYAALLEALPDIVETVTDESGNTYKRFKAGLEPKWNFDSQRNLTYTLPASAKRTPAQAAAIKAAHPDLQRVTIA